MKIESIPIRSPRQTSVRNAEQIGLLFRDTALQVSQLADGGAPPEAGEWRGHALHLVEALRTALHEAMVPASTVDEISYAQCALLDDQALAHMSRGGNEAAWSVWAAEPLQVRLFGNYQAGDEIYARISALLQQPSPSPLLLSTYRTILDLGFAGRYARLDDPERLAFQAALDTKAAAPSLSALSVATNESRWLAFWRRHGLASWTAAALVAVLLLWLALGWHMDTLISQAGGGT